MMHSLHPVKKVRDCEVFFELLLKSVRFSVEDCFSLALDSTCLPEEAVGLSSATRTTASNEQTHSTSKKAFDLEPRLQ
jgi:hypothetical protein